MKFFKGITMSALLVGSLSIGTSVYADESNYEIKVIDSNRASITSGLEVTYKKGLYSYYANYENGEYTVPKNGVTSVTVKYKGTTSTQNVTDLKNNNTFNDEIIFNTVNTKIEVLDTNNQPVEGAGIIYNNGQYSYHLGSTNEHGFATGELFKGDYKYTANLNGTTAVTTEKIGNSSLDKDTDIDYTFEASNVDLNYSGGITYKAGQYSHHYSDNIPLFPGAYEFTFSQRGYESITKNLTVPSGEKLEKSFAYVSLKNSDNNGIEGAKVKYYYKKWFDASDVTNSNGNVLIEVDKLVNKLPIQIWYNGSNKSFILPDVDKNSLYQTNTTKVDVQLKNSNDKKFSINDFSVEYYALRWNEIEADSVLNSKHIEIFPGKYYFAVTYNGARIQERFEIVENPEKNNEVNFQTGYVKLNYAEEQNIKFYQRGWKSYGEPFEFLPVEHKFYYYVGKERKFEAITPISGETVEVDLY